MAKRAGPRASRHPARPCSGSNQRGTFNAQETRFFRFRPPVEASKIPAIVNALGLKDSKNLVSNRFVTGEAGDGKTALVTEFARRQAARWLEVRAVRILSRVLRGQGKGEEAREMLAEVYGWFTEGFDTPDLKEAKALLEALS
jgi:hypothetical protein